MTDNDSASSVGSSMKEESSGCAMWSGSEVYGRGDVGTTAPVFVRLLTWENPIQLSQRDPRNNNRITRTRCSDDRLIMVLVECIFSLIVCTISD
mmetsp:Transcript_6472/g.11768  ORF Transcript_6472/g.11768 Transcript_6472/m.11768 type:complete len:94 (-) Transcript_6472:205-486(-)